MARRILELAQLHRAMRRERVFRDRRNPIVFFTDDELISRYRFSREGIMFITDLIAPDIEHPTRRNHALLPYQQVLIALQYYATGTFQMVVGDPIQVPQPTSCRVVNRVSRALSGKINNFVKLPEQGQVDVIKDGFYRIRNFPGIIGCIDGTHIWIISPHLNEADYVNRKGYHSLNVQVICDHKGRWINIVARWPGSAHDSRVLRSSRMWDIMEAGGIRGRILGDSGYPCRNWLMTPLLNPQTPAERRYNSAHKRTRVLVEQAIGRWKRRFHILHVENRMKSPESACRVIAATAVLHNIALDRNEPEVADIEPGQEQPVDHIYEGQLNGPMTRNYLIQTRFN